MNLPRVLLVAKGLDIGGIERIVVDLAVGLNAASVPTEVAVVNDRRDGLRPLLGEAGVAVHEIGGTDRIGLAAATSLARLVRGRQFQVVHVHGPLPALLARVVPRRAALVTTSHTPWRNLHPAVRAGWKVTTWRDDASLAVSAAVAASMPRSLQPCMRVLPHGVDLRAIEAARKRASHFREASADVQLIAVASHRDVKNYPNLLRAVALARTNGASVQLTAVGEGPGLAAHRAMAEQLGLGEAVCFKPPTRDALQAIGAADVLVVASDFEGQPLVVSEALALGRPVIATAVGRVPELVTPATGRVVPPGDTAALASAILELASDPALRASMSEHAQHVGRALSLADSIAAHVELYRMVLAPTGSG